MPTPRHALSNFTPILRFSPTIHGRLRVFFDSASALDETRTPVTLVIHEHEWDALSLEISGFGVTDVVDSGNMRRITGRVSLVANALNADASDTITRASWLLAEMTFNLPALGKRRKDSHFDFTLPADVQHAVRQGLATAFGLAMDDLTDQLLATQPLFAAINAGTVSYVAGGASAPTQGFTASAMPVAGSSQRRAAAAQPGWFARNKTMALAIGIPAILALLLVLLLSPAPSSDLDMAVASALEENPAAADAQVRLTKKMLDELNLDPGSAADMGCMAAP